MHCVTEKIYEVLRENNIISNIDMLSLMCGKKPSYLRANWSKRLTASLDAMLVLYLSLHNQINQTNNPVHTATLTDMQKLLWLNIQSKAQQKLKDMT